MTLREELDFLQPYVEIELIRLGDRLELRMEIEPAALDARVPHLVLQPLVENAVRHAIAPRVEGGRIEIAAVMQDHSLVLTVRDDGPGLADNEESSAREGVGLANVRARLEQLYGKEHRFELKDHPEGGLAITHMPEVDGFGVMRAVGPGTVPVVIFITAYDQFAVRAFEAHALDYLLKPFDDERFEAALERARNTIRQHREGDLDRRMRALLQEVRPAREYLQRLSVRAGMRTVLVRAAEIDWLEADGKYVRLHVGGRTHLVRDTLTRLEGSLDPSLFRRIHRSTIVNLERVHEIESQFQGIVSSFCRMALG